MSYWQWCGKWWSCLGRGYRQEDSKVKTWVQALIFEEWPGGKMNPLNEREETIKGARRMCCHSSQSPVRKLFILHIASGSQHDKGWKNIHKKEQLGNHCPLSGREKG